MNNSFSVEDIVRSFDWLDNSRWGFTELVAFHRDYRPGPQHYENNLVKRLFPKVWYVKQAAAALRFVECYSGTHTCCYGVNPRPRVLYSKGGGRKRTGDAGIEVVTSFYLDIDPVSDPTDEEVAEAGLFLVKTETYFEDLGFFPPARAFTGRGHHLLFAFLPIKVRECPDIKDRLRVFLHGFQKAFGSELSGLGLKVDNTLDLSRLAKIYGTKKPGGLRVSRFLGERRREDGALREYLLGLTIEEKRFVPAKLPEALPPGFERLLRDDEIVQQLWQGKGKTEGDLSNSGYDFSLVKRCLSKGITDINHLVAILASRPNGAVRMSGKGIEYIRLTISKAIRG